MYPNVWLFIMGGIIVSMVGSCWLKPGRKSLCHESRHQDNCFAPEIFGDRRQTSFGQKSRRPKKSSIHAFKWLIYPPKLWDWTYLSVFSFFLKKIKIKKLFPFVWLQLLGGGWSRIYKLFPLYSFFFSWYILNAFVFCHLCMFSKISATTQ